MNTTSTSSSIRIRTCGAASAAAMARPPGPLMWSAWISTALTITGAAILHQNLAGDFPHLLWRAAITTATLALTMFTVVFRRQYRPTCPAAHRLKDKRYKTSLQSHSLASQAISMRLAKRIKHPCQMSSASSAMNEPSGEADRRAGSAQHRSSLDQAGNHALADWKRSPSLANGFGTWSCLDFGRTAVFDLVARHARKSADHQSGRLSASGMPTTATDILARAWHLGCGHSD